MMNPKTVLRLLPGDDPQTNFDEFTRCYELIGDYGDDNAELLALLKKRVSIAFNLCCARSEANDTFDEAHFQRLSDEWKSERAALGTNGNFNLYDEEDAAFANSVFSISDIAHIQCGYKHFVYTGSYSNHSRDVLLRRGFVCELYEAWPEAALAYEEVLDDELIRARAQKCRQRMEAEGARLYAQVCQLVEGEDVNGVFGLLDRAADMQNADAMTELGLARIYGTYGCARDTDEALRLLRAAANKDNARACFELCRLCDSGIQGIDVHEAKKLCEHAAALGCKSAALRLEEGFDLRPVLDILMEQENNGSIDAIWKIAQEYEREKNLDAAADWFDKAIDAGQVDALLKAAEICMDESCEAYSEEMADKYLRRAAEQGSIAAIIALGDRELKDTSTSFFDTAMLVADKQISNKSLKRDIREQHKKQFAWYLLAAEGGETDVMNYISMSYRTGYPIERDDQEAFLWARRGADAGDGICMYSVAYMYEKGIGIARDVETALSLYIESAQKGIRSSMLSLYRIYLNGLDSIPADAQMAARYLWMSGEGHD